MSELARKWLEDYRAVGSAVGEWTVAPANEIEAREGWAVATFYPTADRHDLYAVAAEFGVDLSGDDDA